MIYFVILHYQAFNETINCVNSILDLYTNYNYQIIVVDNCSPNRSGDELKEYYKDEKRVIVLMNNENIGFARGNNVGYEYARQNDAKFIVQVNNDTIFDDTQFLNKIYDLYDEYRYAVLGPDIICITNGEHQNPMNNFKVSKKTILFKLLKNYVAFYLAYFDLDLLKKKHLSERIYNGDICINDNHLFALQGCCYIFSPLYIKEFDGMFDKTFMYYEEHILDYLCREKNLKMIYSPKLHVNHLRKASTSSLFERERTKRQFQYKHSIHSLKSFYKLLRGAKSCK